MEAYERIIGLFPGIIDGSFFKLQFCFFLWNVEFCEWMKMRNFSNLREKFISTFDFSKISLQSKQKIFFHVIYHSTTLPGKVFWYSRNPTATLMVTVLRFHKTRIRWWWEKVLKNGKQRITNTSKRNLNNKFFIFYLRVFYHFCPSIFLFHFMSRCIFLGFLSYLSFPSFSKIRASLLEFLVFSYCILVMATLCSVTRVIVLYYEDKFPANALRLIVGRCAKSKNVVKSVTDKQMLTFRSIHILHLGSSWNV